MRVAYGCCVGWWDEFQQYVVPRVGDRRVYDSAGGVAPTLVAVFGQTSIAVAYNRILDSLAGDRLDAVVLLHTDLEITDSQFERKIETVLLDPQVALIGVAGARNVGGLAWWEYETVGHQTTDGLGVLDFGVREGDVEALEGSLLVFSPWAIQNLRFDEQYPGFHGYDEIAMQASRAGKRVVVADIDTYHHTAGGFKGESSSVDWRRSAARYNDKWFKGEQ